MKIVIADTSALIRLYVPDGSIPDDLQDYIAAAWRGEAILMVPELALAEFAQILWKKEQEGYLRSSEVDEIIAALMEIPLIGQIHEIEFPKISENTFVPKLLVIK